VRIFGKALGRRRLMRLTDALDRRLNARYGYAVDARP
jgi:hypothetical protein